MSNYEAILEQAQQAKSYLEEIFPDAILIAPALLEEEQEKRIHQAGFGVAEVVTDDGNVQHATYIIKRTRYVQAIERIWELEQRGRLPAGSHESAMDSIMHGGFEFEWGVYMPRTSES